MGGSVVTAIISQVLHVSGVGLWTCGMRDACCWEVMKFTELRMEAI